MWFFGLFDIVVSWMKALYLTACAIVHIYAGLSNFDEVAHIFASLLLQHFKQALTEAILNLYQSQCIPCQVTGY